MVSVDEILAEYLNHRFAGRDSDFWDRRIGTYHASDTGKCLRQVYYEFELGRRERREAYPHFHLGGLTENYIEKALTHRYGRDKIKIIDALLPKEQELAVERELAGASKKFLRGSNRQAEKCFEKWKDWVRGRQ